MPFTLARSGVAVSGGHELAQLMADHRLGDEDRHKLGADGDGDRVTDHGGGDHRAAGPGLHIISGNESGTMRLGTRFRIIQKWEVRREKYRLRHVPQSLGNVDVLVRQIFVDVVRGLAHGTDSVFGGYREDGTGTERLVISRERYSGY